MTSDGVSPKTRLIQDLGLDSAACRTLAWMEAPENLQSLDLAIDGLEKVSGHLPAAIAIVGRAAKDVEFDPIEHLRDGIDELREYLVAHSNDTSFQIAYWQNNNTINPFRNVIGAHPLYAMIGEPCLIGDDIALGNKALVTTIVKALRERATERRPYTNAIRSACNAVRLSINAQLSAHFPALPLENSLKDYHSALDALVNQEKARANGKIGNYLKDCACATKFVIHNKGGHKQTNRIVRDDIELLEDDAPMQIRMQRVISERNLSQNARNDARQSGLSDEELLDDEIFYSPEYLEPEKAPSLAQQVLTRRNVISNLERQAQQLPGRWDVLGSGEIRAFVEGIQKNSLITDVDPLRRNALLMLALMFWTGRSSQMLQHLRVYREESDLPDVMANGSAALVPSTGMFYAPAMRPKGAPRYRNADTNLGRRTTARICLPLGRYGHDWWHLLPPPDPHKKKSGTPVFTGNTDELSKNLKSVLAELVGADHSRVTENRLSRFLFWHIRSACDDVVQASMVTGRADRLADTGLHYFAASLRTLSRTYCESADDILKTAMSQSPQPFDEQQIPDEWCGSPIAPKPDTVHDLAADLRVRFKIAKLSVLTENYRIELHNALAHYVHTMLRFATGLRNVGRILPSLDRINFERKLMFLSDKDDVAGFHSRVVPLPDVVIEQLQLWLQHVDHILSFLDVSSFGNFENSGKRNRQSEKTISPINKLLAQLEQPIFYLQPSGKHIQIINSRNIVSTLPTFGLPENCNRHYLRTELIRRGCNPEYVNHFMGHWARGHQPLDRFGCSIGNHYFDEIRKALSEILKEVGFSVVRGFA